MWKIEFCEEGKKRMMHNLLKQVVQEWDVETLNYDHYRFSGDFSGSNIQLIAVYHESDLNKIIEENWDAGVTEDVGHKWDFEKMEADELIEVYKHYASRLVYKLTEWEVYGYED